MQNLKGQSRGVKTANKKTLAGREGAKNAACISGCAGSMLIDKAPDFWQRSKNREVCH